MDFLSRSGVGLTCTPAEAHYLMGAEEGSACMHACMYVWAASTLFFSPRAEAAACA